MAKKLSEDTEVKLDLKTIAMLVVGTISLASMWFTLQGEIQDLNNKIENFGSDEFVQRIEFNLSGVEPAYVDIPVWTTHNIKNVGKEDLITVFWISEHYNPDDPDVFFEKV